MPTLGSISLGITLVLSIVTGILLFVGQHRWDQALKNPKRKTQDVQRAEALVNIGYLLVGVVVLLLTICIAIIVAAFFMGDKTLLYVAQNTPFEEGPLRPLYLLAGLWGGREGSLLFWAWLIALFAGWIAWQRAHATDKLSTVALGVMSIVIAMFAATMFFSTSNNPFNATPAEYLSESGQLVGVAAGWGMNRLLEHWAMVLHPPTLFVGYAGMTVPFAYGLASLITGDVSRRWVELSNRVTIFAWVMLSIGIGLGAVWAYVVLGWGGYWGWDAVENASLLSWLTGTALLHSMTAYRRRDLMKTWSYVTSMITFIFVILGTFITRSGIVQSVHAFASDPVSTFAFLSMMIAAFLAYAILLVLRKDQLKEADSFESAFSRSGTYYLTNVFMVFSAVLIAYMTLSSALPTWLPLGGQVITAGAYNAVARPLGIIFCAMMAICPLLAWGKTDSKKFINDIKVPAIISVVLFAALMVLFVVRLVPIYDADISEGGTVAATLMEQGPKFYYHALAILGLAVGSLSVCTALVLLVRGIRGRARSRELNPVMATIDLFKKAPATAGGFLTHLGVGVILIGLVGSAMYVQERTINIEGAEGATYEIGGYVLTYKGEDLTTLENGDASYGVIFGLSKDGKELGELTPDIVLPSNSMSMQNQKLNASVMSMPLEDFFVVFRGLNADDSMAVDVKINPLIWQVWSGFIILVIASILSGIGTRARTLVDADDKLLAEKE